jgi:hypothetical protein
MEGMDLMIGMKNQKPAGAHGDEQIGILYLANFAASIR